MAAPKDIANWLSGVTAQTGVHSVALQKALRAGVINPSMAPDDIYKAVEAMASGGTPVRQMQLPLETPVPDIRALIPYGSRGPGVPVQPAASTLYTPEMQAQALAAGQEIVANGPRVTQRGGELIPTPVDPRRFTVSDPAAPTTYTPDMLESARIHGVEAPFPASAAEDMPRGILGLPGRVATPEELEQIARARQMYGSAAGRVDSLAPDSSAPTALSVLGTRGRGVPVGGEAGGPRGLITTPSFADHVRRLARRGFDGLGGGELTAAAGAAGAGFLLGGQPDKPVSTGGEAELAAESRPVPVVEATPAVEWAADKADPVAEAKFTANFKRSYQARHPSFDDLPDAKRKSVVAMMNAGIPQQRANEIVRGKYSISPAEYNLLRSAR